MSKLNTVTLAVIAAVCAGSASAASVDFRHEYKHDRKEHSNRIKMSASTNDFYYGVEMKFVAGKDSNDEYSGPFQNMKQNGSEFDFGYVYKVTDQFYLQPGMPITFGTDSVTFKPQLRVGYKFDSGITAKLRYRHEFRQFEDATEKDNQQKSKVTANLDYSYEQFQFGLESNYEKAQTDDVVYYNNKDYNWDVNMKLGYKIPDSDWRPYVEFGNISVSSDSDKRQLRSRVGVTYSF
ncbi:oligogalacturonate-specific porin KdgM family protein [Photobacterium swingsii]|uniref:oligogalacturonate-specific porin KdgM family protein n=1 Tax=Photobacterium swingsii TaxID=680026 RepID=UPI00352DDB07